jgi:hypothetical protein
MTSASSLLTELPQDGVACPDSFTASGEVSYVALDAAGDALLLQAGGKTGEHGLSGMVWQDAARHLYLYRFGPGDHENIRAFAERSRPRISAAPATRAPGNRRRKPASGDQPACGLRSLWRYTASDGQKRRIHGTALGDAGR